MWPLSPSPVNTNQAHCRTHLFLPLRDDYPLAPPYLCAFPPSIHKPMLSGTCSLNPNSKQKYPIRDGPGWGWCEDRFKKIQPWRLSYSRLLEDSNFKYVSGLTNKHELHLVFATVCAFIILPTGDSCSTYWFCCMKGSPFLIDSMTTRSPVSSGSICLQWSPHRSLLESVHISNTQWEHVIHTNLITEKTQFRKVVSTSIL